MGDQKYVGVQAGVGVVKLRVGSEEVELEPGEVQKIVNGLTMAAFKAKLKRM